MKRAVLLLALAAACSKAPPPPEPEAPEELDTAAVIARSRAFLVAVDHDDAESTRPMLGFSFTKIDGPASDRHFTDASHLLQDLRANYGSPAPDRAYGDEKVFTGPGTATFVGTGAVTSKHQDGGVATTSDFWNTIVWTKGPNGWTVALWQVERFPRSNEEWNEIYRVGRAFRHDPNPLVVAAAQGLEPGRALDVMMGQGRNAVYLASQGWKVTGFDFSDEAIAQAKANAQKQNLEIDAVQAEATRFDYGIEKWDFITLTYPGLIASKEIERIKSSLKPGGMIVIESFHDEEDDAGVAAPARARKTQSWATGELAAQFPNWGILRDESPDDFADWSSPGKVKIVRFVALKRHDPDAAAPAPLDDAGAPPPPPPVSADAGAAPVMAAAVQKPTPEDAAAPPPRPILDASAPAPADTRANDDADGRGGP